MPFRRFATHRPFATLGFVVVAWLLVPIGVKSFTRASFFELTAPVTVAADYARGLQEYRLEHARVAHRDFSGWWQRITLRKGTNYGLTVGAPVVFSGGVVGRVTEVYATTAVVELISSPNVRLAGIVEGENHVMSYQGGINPTFGPPMGIVELVPLDTFASASSPKRLVTSGFGGVFPPGLTIGSVTKVELSTDGLFKTGEVKLDERLGSLTEVTVLVPLTPE